MNDSRNLILAVVLSIIILFGFEFYNSMNRPPPPQIQEQAGQEQIPGPAQAPAAQAVPLPREGAVPPAVPGAPAVPVAESAIASDRTAILGASSRVRIESPRLHGSISLRGGRIDDLTLADYREELDPESPEIIVLSPQGAENAYYAQFGWAGGDGVQVPGSDTQWTADKNVLAPASPVTLSWDNGRGLRFSQTFAIDDNFMFTLTQRVENTGNEAASVFPYGLILRQGTPTVTGYIILHEGLLGVFDGILEEVDYDDDDLSRREGITKATTGGWFGITDKYWLTAMLPDQKSRVNAHFTHRLEDGIDRYQVDFIGAKTTIAPRSAAENETSFFIGAKEVNLLDGYEQQLGVADFDKAIDFGWLYWLTKPIFYLLIYINDHVGNFGVSILLLTVIIKLAFFPLANKSYRAMSKMKKLQPEMLKLRERFGDDKARLNQEMMGLYKREKANPASGCLPVIIQIPVFFALYKVLFVTIEMRHAPFFGWIKDLSVSDPTTIFNLFGLLPFAPPDFIPEMLNIGVWPLVMGISMFLQQKLNPQPTDPVQAKIFLFLPIMFTFLLATFPAGLVIYWAWNNSLSILQQWVIMRRMGVKV